jgi:phage baseplate assembly protein V
MFAELRRSINNIVCFGTVSQTKSTDGEQVVMFSPFGEANGGFILRSIFNKNAKEPALANEHTEVMEYEDGTVISYDTKAKELKINASDKITIICKAATVTADTVNVTATTVDVAADSVTVDSSAIDLGVGGTGVVTGECICAFTGAPHGDISSTVKAVK